MVVETDYLSLLFEEFFIEENGWRQHTVDQRFLHDHVRVSEAGVMG